MFMVFVMLFSWQATNDTKYKGPTTKSLEAFYANSEAKSNIDLTTEYIKKQVPLLTGAAVIGYSGIVKKQVTYTTTRFSLFRDAVTTYNYDNNNHSGSIGIVWHY